MSDEKQVYLLIDRTDAYDDDGCIRDVDDFVYGVIEQFPEIHFIYEEYESDCMLKYGYDVYELIEQCDEVWVFTAFFNEDYEHPALEYANDIGIPVVYDPNMW